MNGCTILKTAVAASLAAACVGCVKPGPLPQPEPRTAITQLPEMPAEMNGQLLTFGKLRTVILPRETIVMRDGRTVQADEIGQALQEEFARRDFRMFVGPPPAKGSVAELSRKTQAQLVVALDATSKFVNSTGRFSKFRAQADVKAVRGRDGTLLAASRVEKMGPRHQDDERAGRLALSSLSEALCAELIEKLYQKSDDLLWAGLVINNVRSMQDALGIQNKLESQPAVSYVELLEWDKETKTATYEVIYGLKHESDIAALVTQHIGIKTQMSHYTPGTVEALKKRMLHFK
ncbi:MAG: hypothetical protein JXR37_15355 [Kiritimatiellae bacterium]|nr:hypothetical protein [Kiritimatiellia bacterium]